MRRCVLVSLLFLFIGHYSLLAQDLELESEGGYFERGDMTVEITGTPFDGSSLLNFGSFRARYAVTNSLVPRLGVSIDLSNNQSTPEIVVNSNSYTLRPGLEYHLTNSGGFKSYAALDLIIGQRSASYESSIGSSVEGTTYLPSSPNSSISSKGYFAFGTGLSVGADYHFGSRFYVGTEIGFQWTKYNYVDVLVDGQLFQAGTSSNIVNINAMNSFRVGFKLF